ncbi:peptide chain release factor 1-like, mitochondrial [Diachasma alloeum]|uniref:peptide chain release factor 1-like, mitochondrial n=1 Tax=Diachasma alloeum TaxID=454923 RepID=UPI00073831C2|nr:peptide chain release factor 1-like, mitochondrial [Diachasma alloeum]
MRGVRNIGRRYQKIVREVADILEDRLKLEENITAFNELAAGDEEIKKLGFEEQRMYINYLNELDNDLLEIILDNLGRDKCRNVVFEVTAGVGGSEAMIFAADLFAMYQRYFDRLGYSQESIEINAEAGVGGIRYASVLVSGERVFEILRHEGGVHRVQRIPSTEKNGRIHTSTAAVAVLPQLTDIEITIKDNDLKIETKKATGAGGQHVNTTDSAVRITHIPTGIVVEAQTDRSQIRNRKIAMMKLRAKIYEQQLSEQKAETGSMRKKQKGLSMRNEKIRTYNYSQDRITDHRIADGTLHNLKGFMATGERLEELQGKLQRQLQLKILQEAIERWK